MRGSYSPMISAPALAAGAVFICLSAATPASAGILTLASGERLQGRLATASPGHIGFISTRFGPMVIEPSALQSYKSEGPVTIELASGERVVADAFAGDTDGFRATTKFGETRGAWAEVVTMSELEAPSGSQQAGAAAGDAQHAGPAPRPPASPARNTLTLDFAHQGNQLSTLAGGKRSHLTSLEATYDREIGGGTTVSVALPLYYNQVALTDFGETTTARRASIGDVRLSLSRVFRSHNFLPHVQAAVSVGLPTGSTGGPNDRTLAGFSSGVWSVGGLIGLQKTLGGGAILASGGYTLYFPRGGGRSTHSVDWAFGYNAQVAEGWSFGTAVQGSFAQQNGATVEPTYLSLRARFSSGRVAVSPYVLMGLNTDAEDYKVGLSISRSW